MTALYLCYQSIQEPLTQTQVVSYLEGLALARYRSVLLTFEPKALAPRAARVWSERLRAKGIAWHWLRYHKRPTVPATAWDILTGTELGLRLIRRYRVCLLHARSHVPGVMAIALKRLTGRRMLLDLRGFMAEEYVDAGVWPAGGVLFCTTKRVERALVEAADGIVVLTRKAKGLLEKWYPQEIAGKPIAVIPCCIDLRRIPAQLESPPGPAKLTLVYAGKLGGWYLTEAMVGFVAAARELLPEIQWDIWTQSDPAALWHLLRARNLERHVSVAQVLPEDLPGRLSRARAALSFVKPCLSKLASSPTKVGEYLAAGLPVIAIAGIGDLDEVLTGATCADGEPVGIVLPACTVEAYREAVHQLLRLLNDPRTPERCRAAAARHFDLERIGWSRYGELYRELLQR
jgi:glycosyltransferase involved in cell wall biosynthesis